MCCRTSTELLTGLSRARQLCGVRAAHRVPGLGAAALPAGQTDTCLQGRGLWGSLTHTARCCPRVTKLWARAKLAVPRQVLLSWES